MPMSTSEIRRPPRRRRGSRRGSGISMSRPSTEKRVLPGKARCRNCSKASTWLRRSSSSTSSTGSTGGRKRPGLGGMAQPVALFGHEDVRVVVAGGRAVDPPQRVDRLEGVGGGRGDRTADQAGRQPRQHPVREAVERRRQRWVAVRGGAQRIERGGEVPVAADALGQVDRADDLGDVGAVDDPAGGGGRPRHPGSGRRRTRPASRRRPRPDPGDTGRTARPRRPR